MCLYQVIVLWFLCLVVCRTSSSVDLSVSSTEPATDGAGHSAADPAPAPVIDLIEENLAPAVGTSAMSLAVALVRDMIGSLQGVAPQAPQTTAPELLPEAAPVDEPPASDIPDAVLVNAAATEAPKLETARALDSVAAAIGTSFEAGASFSQGLVLAPGVKVDLVAKDLAPPK